MNSIVITKEETNLNNSLVNSIYRLRHETFIGRLDWDIESTDGLEKDRFDELNPFHIAVQAEDGSVNGCWRALPTTGDYMLRSVFPELLQGEDLPEGDDIWEISRFAVRKGSSKVATGYMSEVTIDMVRSFGDFAKHNGINHYVAVTTVACERMLRQLGIKIRRLGEGQSMQIGIERTVALWIEVNSAMNIEKQ